MIRLRDSLIKMGEEMSRAEASESQQRESSQYYQRRLEELKADMEELVQREAEASRRCMELVSPVASAGAHMTQGLGSLESFLGTGKAFLMGGPRACLLDLWGRLGETEGDGLGDGAAIGCKPWGRGQSGPMIFSAAGRPRASRTQSVLSNGRAASCKEEGTRAF